MKNCLTIVLFLLGCCAWGVEPKTNVCIYLVANKIPLTIYALPPPPTAELKLISPPVISDVDFLSFDLTNRTFTIKAEAAKRLAREIWKLNRGEPPYIGGGGLYELVVSPCPYVLMASGERICSGMFWTLNWSNPPQFPGPTMLPDEPFLKRNQKRSVRFSISSKGFALDPCQDSRVAAAVREVFAHEKR